mmetsp:Transcript_2373/g.5382  ORF Transcript_2373/g.5382 Transcript_2373/m.5382 type:complete len:210 (+) Transcript_2373:214-843(+)
MKYLGDRKASGGWTGATPAAEPPAPAPSAPSLPLPASARAVMLTGLLRPVTAMAAASMFSAARAWPTHPPSTVMLSIDDTDRPISVAVAAASLASNRLLMTTLPLPTPTSTPKANSTRPTTSSAPASGTARLPPSNRPMTSAGVSSGRIVSVGVLNSCANRTPNSSDRAGPRKSRAEWRNGDTGDLREYARMMAASRMKGSMKGSARVG